MSSPCHIEVILSEKKEVVSKPIGAIEKKIGIEEKAAPTIGSSIE
jgi:hypothetical protein